MNLNKFVLAFLTCILILLVMGKIKVDLLGNPRPVISSDYYKLAHKDTNAIEIQESSHSTYMGGITYELYILVDKSSNITPEELYLIEKDTKLTAAVAAVIVSGDQINMCRDFTDPAKNVLYQSYSFALDDLKAAILEGPLKRNFDVVVVYKNELGVRYYSVNSIANRCQVFGE